MTLTIEIAPETQRAIEGKAARLGVPVERYAAGVLRRDAESNDMTAQEKQSARLAAIQRAHGSMRGVPGTVADFMRERSECDNL